MRLEKETISTYCHCSFSYRLNEGRLPPRHSASLVRTLEGVCDVHDDREPCATHRWYVGEVHYKVRVAKAIASLCEDDLLVTAFSNLMRCMLHTRGR